MEMDGPLSLSLSPSEGERVPKSGEGAVQGYNARMRSDKFHPNPLWRGRGGTVRSPREVGCPRLHLDAAEGSPSPLRKGRGLG